MAILGYDKFDLVKWLETRHLAGWLEIATRNLEAPAKQRIAHEIEAHYAEAVNAHTAAGKPEFSAQDTALAELGDPRVAAVNFEKTYLTASEAKWMQSWERIAATPLSSSSMLRWDITPLVALPFLYPNPQSFINFRFIAVVVLMAYAVLRLIPRSLGAIKLRRIHFLQALALWSCLPLVALGWGFGTFSYTHRDTTRVFFDFLGIVNAAFLTCFWGFYRNAGWRIWNKLRKTVAAPEHRDATPPSQIIST